jgi:ATP-dependent Clp protease ATP-binding subunit ClpC
MKKVVLPPALAKMNLSEDLLDIFNKCSKYAAIDKSNEISTANFLYAIIAEDRENILVATLQAMNVDINILYEQLKEVRSVKVTTKKSTTKAETDTNVITLSDELKKLIVKSYNSTVKSKPDYDIIDLFLTILETKNSISDILFDNAIEIHTFNETLTTLLDSFNASLFYTDDDFDDEPEPIFEKPKNANEIKVMGKPSFSAEDIVKTFTVNLNEEYEKGNLPECIGRDTEIETLERVLSRTNKKNSILIGKAGVGKTQIVEGLVSRIINRQVSNNLQNKIVLSLNVNDLEAGTSWRGQLEEKIKMLVNYLQENPNIILFIDEIHSIIGVGKNNNSDLANSLKPYLSRNKMQVIGATTLEEYKMYIENNRAFTRRFFVQHISELDANSTLEILKKIKNKYEKYHNVSYSNEILNDIIIFADKYLKNRSFPDKAIDIMDDLGAALKVQQKNNKEIITLNKELNDLKLTKKYIIQNKKYDESESILALEESLKQKMDKITKVESKKQKITKQMFVDYLKNSLNIENYYGDNFEEQLEFAQKEIKKEFFEQDEVLDGVFNQIRVKKLFDDYSSPLTLMFVGDSGVGKTFLGELISKHLYNNKIKVVNCELYKEKHTVSNLIGSPKGYVDSDKGSDLFEFIKYNPESVIMFDEIEKAHPDFYDVILTLIDKGYATDKDGSIVDVRRSLIILTSNNGNEYKSSNLIGYNNTVDAKLNSKKSIEGRFKPEFVNRIDEIFQFNKVDNFEKILNLEFESIKTFMKSKNIEVDLSSETKTEILEYCKKESGAIRNLKKIISKKIKQNIAKNYKKEKALRI